MEEVFDKIYATTPVAMPGAPSLGVRSFLLRREAGNLLVYGSDICHAEHTRGTAEVRDLARS
jgi:hypothetical protein